MKLYDVAFSSNCKKVRICAHELGLPLELVPVDPMAGGNRTPEYLSKNPMGKVPTIDDNGFVLWESGAILVHMAGKKPEVGLYPPDPVTQADILRWMFWGVAHVSPFMTMLVLERVIKPRQGKPGNDPHIIAYAEGELARFLPVLEEQLKTRAHVAGNYSIADISLGCSMETAAMVKHDLGKYPNIGAWLARIQAREAWQKARPAGA